jgi:hypothetical protein
MSKICNRKYSISIYVIIYFTFIFPATGYYVIGGMLFQVYFSIICCFFGVLFLTKNTAKQIRVFKKGSLSSTKVVIILFLCLVVALIHAVTTTAGNYIYAYSDIYKHRAVYSDALSSGIMGYFNGWVYKVITPLLGCILLYMKKYKLFAFMFFLDFVAFLFNGQKSILANVILELFLYIYLVYDINDLRRVARLVQYFMLFLIAFLYFTHSASISFLTVRVFETPYKVYNDCFKYIFTGNAYYMWQNGIIGELLGVAKTTNASLAHIIGEYNGTGDSANSGYISSAFASAGWLGVIITSGLMAVIMNIINFSMKDPAKRFIVVGTSISSILQAYISSDLFTTMLTHGLLLAILLCFIIKDVDFERHGT